MLRVTTQYSQSKDIMIERTLPENTDDPEVDHWLNLKSRCFGDKGDVEDITEG